MIRFDEISGSDEITNSPTSLDTSFAEMSKPEAYSLGVDDLLSEVFQDMSDPRSSSPLSVGDALVPPTSKKRKSSRRRSNNPAFHPEIRIFRRDIRRRYALMFGNVMNSCDSSLFSDFLKEFAVPHFEAHEEISEGVEIKLIRMKVIRGQDEFVKFLGINFTMMPDGVFRLSSAKVCQRLNSPGSRVVLHGSMLGTMLYEVRSLTNGEEIKESPYYAEDLQTPPSMQLLPQPYEYSLHMILTMQLDCDHRIVSFLLKLENTEERSLQ